MRWSYGVTTVPEREHDLLPATLASLAAAGFDGPWLFADGLLADGKQHMVAGLTMRTQRVRVAGAWILAIMELYLRNPEAERFAVFQDDLLVCRNLRRYLEVCLYPENGYLNLYTHPLNQQIAPLDTEGWYLSNQRGLGALALVFDRITTMTLLSSRHLIDRAQDVHRGWRSIDGGIITAMHHEGIKEFVHNPTLVQHTGEVSAVGNRRHPVATSWRGEQFDPTTLLQPCLT